MAAVWLGMAAVWVGIDTAWVGMAAVWVGMAAAWVGMAAVWVGMAALENRTSFPHFENRNRNPRSFDTTLSLHPLSYPFHGCINIIVLYDVAMPCTSAERRQHYAEKRVQLVPPERWCILIYQSMRCHECAVPRRGVSGTAKVSNAMFPGEQS